MIVQAAGAALLAPQAGTAEAFLAVALAAIGNAVVFPALNGMVAAQLPPEQRPRAYALRFGILNAGIGIGGLVSGSIVSIDRPVTFQAIYLADAAATAVYAAIVLVGLRRSPGFAPVPHDASAGTGHPAGGYRAVLANRPFVGFLACAFLFSLFGYAQLDGPWAAFATLVVGVDPAVVGLAFAVNTAVIVVSQLLVVRLTAAWRRTRLLLAAGVLWAVAWAVSAAAALPVLHGLAAVGLIVSLGVFGLGETLFSPVAGGLPNELATETLRARYNALGSTVVSVAGFVGPPIAGLLLGSGAPEVWAPIVGGGMVLAIGGAALLGRLLPSAVDRPVPAAR